MASSHCGTSSSPGDVRVVPIFQWKESLLECAIVEGSNMNQVARASQI